MSNNPHFSFYSGAFPSETFEVLSFTGREALSELFRFQVELVSRDPKLDLELLLDGEAVLNIQQSEQSWQRPGMLESVSQGAQIGPWTRYRVVLAPPLHLLEVSRHDRVFLNQSVPEVLESVLKNNRISKYEFRLQSTYEAWEYLCQFGESDLDFLHRWMEREGIYYFVEHNSEKIIITDSKIVHTHLPDAKPLELRDLSGLDALRDATGLYAFSHQQGLCPKEIRIRDLDVGRPGLDLSATRPVRENGIGSLYYYGRHPRNPSESARMARLESERILAREHQYEAFSRSLGLKPGYLVDLEAGSRSDLASQALVLSVEHEGRQSAGILAGWEAPDLKLEAEPSYQNQCRLLTTEHPFRPECRTPWARIHGFLSAHVDGEGSGEYPELDEQGRYKIRLPFDGSDRKAGKASAWFPLLQPYGGVDRGMHFPLRKGAEVLLGFCDGDPDRPILMGALPHAGAPSPVRDENQTKSLVSTSGGNWMALQDQEGKEHAVLSSPTESSWIRLGQPNDPPNGSTGDAAAAQAEYELFKKLFEAAKVGEGKAGWSLSTSGAFNVYCGCSNSIIVGESSSSTGGLDSKTVVGIRTDTTLIYRTNFTLAWVHDIVAGSQYKCATQFKEMSGFHTKAVAEQREALATSQTVNAAREAAHTQLNDLAGLRDDLEAQRNLARGAAEAAELERTDMEAAVNTARAQKQQAALQLTEAKASLTQVQGDLNSARVQEEKLTAVANKVLGQLTEIGQQAQGLHATLNDIHGLANIM